MIAVMTAGVVLATAGIAPEGRAAGCARPISSGSVPTASDCLFILRSAVGLVVCPACDCDPDGSGSISAIDALLCLKKSVGQPVELGCPCTASTTTLASTTTSITTTTSSTSTTFAGPTICGDGHISGDEQCDDGGNNSDAKPCTGSCRLAVCGDGLRCFFPSCTSGPGGGTEQCDGDDDLACPGSCQPDCSCSP